MSLTLSRKNVLQDADEWLEGQALDAALSEATKDCPDLLQLVDLDGTYKEDLFLEYEALKESSKQDEEYLCLLRRDITGLK